MCLSYTPAKLYSSAITSNEIRSQLANEWKVFASVSLVFQLLRCARVDTRRNGCLSSSFLNTKKSLSSHLKVNCIRIKIEPHTKCSITWTKTIAHVQLTCITRLCSGAYKVCSFAFGVHTDTICKHVADRISEEQACERAEKNMIMKEKHFQFTCI